MARTSNALLRTLGLAICSVGLSFAGCSGGGGEGGSKGRTTSTAVRILHGALDEAPLSVSVGGTLRQTAAFGDVTEFQEVEEGTLQVTVHRANSPSDISYNSPNNFVKAVEYTVFASGQARDGQFRVQIVPEAVQKPEDGRAFIRVFNGFSSDAPVRVVCDDVQSGPVGRGSVSDFIDVPSGPRVCRVLRGSGELQSISLDLEDGSETALLVAGAEELGFSVVRAIVDLD
ncbi:MAG: DUF4397 domain-containing protein [Deltaproteobacteria bacterium]|nr:DUF4397 domain-containing protein [Deltaproteobacteria bacterium]